MALRGRTVLRKPNTYYQQMPITSFAGWDRTWQIEGVLNAMDRGEFRQAAILCDAMMRDDRVSGVMDTRIGSLLASPITARPARAIAKAARIAREIEGDDDNVGLWEELFPAPLIRGLSKWGNFLNIAVAEMIWDTSLGVGKWMPRLKLWHPQFIWWNQSEFRYYVNTAEGQIPLPRVDENPRSDGRWVVWCPRGFQNGWMDALVRRLAHIYIMRGWIRRDWSRYSEKHGLAILGAITPANAEEEVKQRFVDQIANLGAESAVELPQGVEGEKFDLKAIEPVARTWQSFQMSKKEFDSDIAIAILGQDMTTQSHTSGGMGSKQSEVHERVALDRRREDAKLAECLRLQALTHWAEHNYSDPELAPVVTYDVDPADDEAQEAAAMKGLGDAVISLNTASGDAVDVPAIYDEWGIPMLSPEQVAANKQAALEEAQAQMAATGGPGGAAGAGGGGAGGGQDSTQQKKPPPFGQKKALSAGRDVAPGPVKHYEFQGLPIAVENPAGTHRVWKDEAANVIGTTKMLHDYGFIQDVQGSDGEELDVYVGPDAEAKDVHVVHQLRAPDFKAHDEDKTMLGFSDATAAKTAYLAHRNDGEQAFGGMSTIPLDRFKAKLQRRTGGGKIRATAVLDTETTALEALVVRSTGTALRGSRNANGARRARLYSDAVAANAVKMAARVLSSDLAGMKAEIDAAESFDDLKARIIRRYKGMDPTALAAVLRKANLLAHLGGRVTALKQL